MTRVLPEPAPARMSSGPSVVRTAVSCSGLRSKSRKPDMPSGRETPRRFFAMRFVRGRSFRAALDRECHLAGRELHELSLRRAEQEVAVRVEGLSDAREDDIAQPRLDGV